MPGLQLPFDAGVPAERIAVCLKDVSTKILFIS